MNQKLNISIKIALLSALAFILMYLEFPLPLFPQFLKFDLSDIPALLGGFAFGPVAGVIVEAIKIALHLFIKGTTTGGVGELANFLIGIAFVVPAAWIYMRRKSFKTAIIGALIGLLISCVVSGLANYYLLIPVYSKFMPIEQIIEMCKAVNPAMNSVLMYVLLGAVPFTALKFFVDCVIIFLLYKRLSPVLHKNQFAKKVEQSASKKVKNNG